MQYSFIQLWWKCTETVLAKQTQFKRNFDHLVIYSSFFKNKFTNNDYLYINWSWLYYGFATMRNIWVSRVILFLLQEQSHNIMELNFKRIINNTQVKTEMSIWLFANYYKLVAWIVFCCIWKVTECKENSPNQSGLKHGVRTPPWPYLIQIQRAVQQRIKIGQLKLSIITAYLQTTSP